MLQTPKYPRLYGHMTLRFPHFRLDYSLHLLQRPLSLSCLYYSFLLLHINKDRTRLLILRWRSSSRRSRSLSSKRLSASSTRMAMVLSLYLCLSVSFLFPFAKIDHDLLGSCICSYALEAYYSFFLSSSLVYKLCI